VQRRPLVGALWLGVVLSWVPSGRAVPVEPLDQAAEGVVYQQVLPALQARLEQAQRRQLAREGFFSGEVPFPEAFPHLMGWELSKGSVLQARLSALSESALTREQERASPLPAVSTEEREEEVRDLRGQVLDAEARADALESRLIHATQAFLRQHAELTHAQWMDAQIELSDNRARWEAELAQGNPNAAAELALVEGDAVRWERLWWSIWQRGVRQRGPKPSPQPELDLLAGEATPWRALQAVSRLERVRPWVSAEDRQALDTAMEVWSRDVPLPLPVPPGLDEELLTTRLARMQGIRKRWSRRAETADSAQRQLIARRLVSGLDEEIDMVTEAISSFSAAQEEAQKVAEAREQARAAEKEAAKAPDAALTMAAESAAWRADQWQAVGTAIKTLRKNQLQLTDDLRVTMDEVQVLLGAKLDTRIVDVPKGQDAVAEVMNSLGLSPVLDPNANAEGDATEGEAPATEADDAAKKGEAASSEAPPPPDPDEVFEKLRGFTKKLRERITDGVDGYEKVLANAGVPDPPTGRQARLDTLREAAELRSGADRDAALARVAQAEKALQEEAEAQEAYIIATDAAHALWLADLRAVKEARHRLRPQISPEERSEERSAFLLDLSAETRLLPVQAQAWVMHQLRELRSLPGRLLDFNFLTWGMSTSLWLLGLWVLWQMARERSTNWAKALLPRLRVAKGPTGWMNTRKLEEPASELMRYIVNTAGFSLLMVPARVVSVELWIILGWFVWRNLFRAFAAAFRMCTTRLVTGQPLMIYATPEGVTKVERGLSIVGIVATVSWTVRQIFVQLFFADALGDLWNVLVILGALGGVLWLAWLWEPNLSVRIHRLGSPPKWLQPWIDRPDGSWLAIVRANIFLAYLVAAGVWSVAQGTLASSGFGNVVDRVRFNGEVNADDEEMPRLAPDVLSIFLDDRQPSEEERKLAPKSAEALKTHVEGWRREERRGTIVVTTDRTEDDPVTLEFIEAFFEPLDLPIRRAGFSERIVSESEMVRWFCEAFELEEYPETVDALVERLSDVEASVVMITDAHLTFLRAVGGFEALRTLFYVCNGSSRNHLWVLVTHSPAWAYLSRLSGILSLGVVRGVVNIPPWDGARLRKVVMARCQEAELIPNFHRLENTGPFGAPPEEEREHATAAYFRLLADAAGGRRRLALYLWTESLRMSGEGKAEVILLPELGQGVLSDLDAIDLFILASLRMMERLSIEELSVVIDTDEGDVRARVRKMDQRDIIEFDEDEVRLVPTSQEKVVRTLQRRQFFQWKV